MNNYYNHYMNNAILVASAIVLLALSNLLSAGDQETQAPSGVGDIKQSGSGLQPMTPEERQRFNDDLESHSSAMYPDHDQIESRRQLMREKILERFQRADTDNDNSLSLTEATLSMPGLARRFDAVDTNHDGVITFDEIKAVYEKRREALEQKTARDKEALLPADKKRSHKVEPAPEKHKRGKKSQQRNDSPSSDNASSIS